MNITFATLNATHDTFHALKDEAYFVLLHKQCILAFFLPLQASDPIGHLICRLPDTQHSLAIQQATVVTEILQLIVLPHLTERQGSPSYCDLFMCKVLER